VPLTKPSLLSRGTLFQVYRDLHSDGWVTERFAAQTFSTASDRDAPAPEPACLPCFQCQLNLCSCSSKLYDDSPLRAGKSPTRLMWPYRKPAIIPSDRLYGSNVHFLFADHSCRNHA
jgi:hypothetical protein